MPETSGTVFKMPDCVISCNSMRDLKKNGQRNAQGAYTKLLKMSQNVANI